MKTRIKKEGNTTIVTLEGKLDFETHLPLRESLAQLIGEEKSYKTVGVHARSSEDTSTSANEISSEERKDQTPKKIIFNLEKLEFVGSSGITSFVQTLKDFNSVAPSKPVYTNVKSEFKRVIKAFDETNQFEFIEPSSSNKTRST